MKRHDSHPLLPPLDQLFSVSALAKLTAPDDPQGRKESKSEHNDFGNLRNFCAEVSIVEKRSEILREIPRKSIKIDAKFDDICKSSDNIR